jgi:hypothetical protein
VREQMCRDQLCRVTGYGLRVEDERVDSYFRTMIISGTTTGGEGASII